MISFKDLVFSEIKSLVLRILQLPHMRLFAIRISSTEISPQAVDQISWGYLRSLMDSFKKKEFINSSGLEDYIIFRKFTP